MHTRTSQRCEDESRGDVRMRAGETAVGIPRIENYTEPREGTQTCTHKHAHLHRL